MIIAVVGCVDAVLEHGVENGIRSRQVDVTTVWLKAWSLWKEVAGAMPKLEWLPSAESQKQRLGFHLFLLCFHRRWHFPPVLRSRFFGSGSGAADEEAAGADGSLQVGPGLA